MERVLGNKVIFSNLVIYSLSILTSCQFTNEPNREISRGVLQNRGVCRQAFPLLPSPSLFHFFAPALTTRLETLASQANAILTQMIRFWIPPMMRSDCSVHTTWFVTIYKIVLFSLNCFCSLLDLNIE